jgi:Peptidase U49
MKAGAALLLAVSLLLSTSARGFIDTDSPPLYSDVVLISQKARFDGRVHELYKILTTVLSVGEQRALARVAVDLPLRAPSGNPLDFFAYGTGDGPRIAMPVQSLLFVEDLCTAYAWLQQNGYSLETVDEYLTMLKYREAAAFPDGRYPPPLVVLGIPADAASDPAVNNLALRLRNSAYAFILAHELGHIVLNHRGYSGITMEQARANEAAADQFALDALQRTATIPMGAVLFFQAQAYAMPNLGQFRAAGKSSQEWENAVRKNMTHPLTADRITAIAVNLDVAAASWPRPTEQPILRSIAIKLAQIAEILEDVDLQQCIAIAAARADPQALQPRRPGGTYEFLRRCVKP